MGVRAANSANDQPALSVRFPPIWGHIVPLTQYVTALLEAKGRSDGSDRVSLVVHELLENAVKYGDPANEVKLEVSAEPGQPITIRVTNRAHPSRVTVLERELRRTRGLAPQEAFTKALERLTQLPEGSTMLGLARVALESELDVQALDGAVVVTARIDTSLARTAHAGKKPVGSARAESAPMSSPDGRARELAPSNASQTRRVDRPPSGSISAVSVGTGARGPGRK